MQTDLNVPWPQKAFSDPAPSAKQIANLHKTLSTLHTLGYTHIAINFTIAHSDKPAAGKPYNPIDLSHFDELCAKTGLKLYTRVTIVIDEPSQGQSLSKLSQYYDIIVAMPLSEKGMTLVTSLDVDMVTFQYGMKLPFFLKHKTVCGLVNKGVKIEVVYGAALRDSFARRNFINTVKNVVRSGRSRGVVVTSGAASPLECRNALSVKNILKLCGADISEDNASKVLLAGRLRNQSYKQVVCVGRDVVNKTGAVKIVKRQGDDSEESAKRQRVV